MVKIYRTFLTFENDRLEAQGFVSLHMTMQSSDGWELHSISHAGHKSDKPEIHRYITVFSKEADEKEAMQHVFDEILMEDIAKFDSLEEVEEYVENRYEEKYNEMQAEGTDTGVPGIPDKLGEKHEKA